MVGLFYALECPDHDYKRPSKEMLEQIEFSEEMGGLTLDGLRQGSVVLLGTPQTAIDEIEKLRDELGLQSLCCWLRMGGLEHEKVMNSIEMFGKHVIAAFKDRRNVVPKALRESVTA